MFEKRISSMEHDLMISSYSVQETRSVFTIFCVYDVAMEGIESTEERTIQGAKATGLGQGDRSNPRCKNLVFS